ncbi:MAG: response regulator transcription factor [Bacteroidales bacterium]|nr:response regulator transcription factor [Bacteroidales bacterium]
MKMFRDIEIFQDGYGRDLYLNFLKDHKVVLYDTDLKDFIEYAFQYIKENYPKAFKRLLSNYGHKKDNKFLMVRRFLKCNFTKNDHIPDIDSNGEFHLECVHCPLKGECSDDGIICNPELNTKLSDREMEVAKLYATGINKFDISEQLFISEHTVSNHVRKIFLKLEINSQAQLVVYMHDKNFI